MRLYTKQQCFSLVFFSIPESVRAIQDAKWSWFPFDSTTVQDHNIVICAKTLGESKIFGASHPKMENVEMYKLTTFIA